MSARDRYERFTPETAEPVGRVHYEEYPVPVRWTNRVLRPDLTLEQDAWVIAWTRNAVLVLFVELRVEGKQLRTRWVKPERVRRLHLEDPPARDGSSR